MAARAMPAEGVFVLCDISQQGFPIQFASQGFTDLYGYGQAECIGKKCGALVGGQSVKADAQALARAAEASGLALDEAAHALDKLAAHAAEQCRSMFGDGRSGFTLLLNRKKSGAVFTCELLTVVLERADLGWSFAIGLQRDVTRTVPVGTLLAAAARGELQDLVDESKVGVASRLAQLGIGSSGVARHMHDSAVGRMEAMRPSTSSTASTSSRSRAAKGSSGCDKRAQRQQLEEGDKPSSGSRGLVCIPETVTEEPGSPSGGECSGSRGSPGSSGGSGGSGGSDTDTDGPPSQTLGGALAMPSAPVKSEELASASPPFLLGRGGTRQQSGWSCEDEKPSA